MHAVEGFDVSDPLDATIHREEGHEHLVLELPRAMESPVRPDWSGARWIGAVDLTSLNGHKSLKLRDSEGYERARLLVREGSSVRGFVDVEAPGGVLDRATLDSATAALPEAEPVAAAVSAPSITVVICTRDRASVLRGALEALLSLDYPDYDILVVDNAARSTETKDMVRQEFQDPRIRLIEEPVPGLSHARNTGLEHARGDIVAFTDDDVVVDHAWLREIAAGFERAPVTACVTWLVPAGEVRSRAQGYFD